GDQDWFRFTINQTGATGDRVKVNYSPINGQGLSLSLRYTNANGQQQQLTSNTGSGQEIVSLTGLAAGEYLIKVTGNGTTVVPDYSLSIDAPGTVTNGNDWVGANTTALGGTCDRPPPVSHQRGGTLVGKLLGQKSRTDRFSPDG
ncbi:MAG: T9SS type A sorting domain-containing protein, partial [Dolichospermum sp.]